MIAWVTPEWVGCDAKFPVFLFLHENTNKSIVINTVPFFIKIPLKLNYLGLEINHGFD